MRIIAAILLLLAFTTSFAGGNEDPFEQLMEKAELTFSKPDGFTRLPSGSNPFLDYERALRSEDGKLEIRLSIRPIKGIKIDYDDPHSAAPNPDHIFPLAFESLTSTLAGRNYAPSNEYSQDEARRKFNADWAAISAFDLAPGYPSTHKQALFLAVHRNHVADAYMLLLYDDYKREKQRIKEVMEHLRFRDEQAATKTAGNY